MVLELNCTIVLLKDLVFYVFIITIAAISYIAISYIF